MISIIVPVFNEEECIREVIVYLKSVVKGEEAELIIVDGGSTDQTQAICRQEGIRPVLSDAKGRANQMNKGASVAKGEVLYFLHVDSFPPSTLIGDIKESIQGKVTSACYRLSFKPSNRLLDLYAWFTRFDIDYFRFGDQSLIVDRAAFFEAGGFDETLIVMEDQEIVKRLKAIGDFKIIDKKIVTSSRKYKKVGTIKLQIVFACIVILYYLGVDQKALVQFYKENIRY